MLASFKKYRLYTALILASSGIGLLKLALFPNLVGPDDFGFYSLILTTYLLLIYMGSLGANEYVLKVGAQSFARGGTQAIVNIRTIASFYGFGGILFLGGSSITVACFVLDDPRVESALIWSLVLALCAILFNIFDAGQRAKQKYLSFATMVFSRNGISLLLGLALVDHWGVEGLAFAEIISFFVVFVAVFVLFGNKHVLPNVRLWRVHLKEIYKHGFFTLISMLIRNISLSLDRYVITATLGLKLLGGYSLAMVAYQMIVVVGGLLTNVIGPRLLASAASAEGKSSADILKKINRYTTTFLILGAVLFLPIALLLPTVLEALFSKYDLSQVIPCVHAIYFGSLILVSLGFYDWYFISQSKESMLIKLSVSLLIMTVIGILCLVHFEAGIVAYSVLFLLLRLLHGAAYAVTIWSLNRCGKPSV